jgi:hypothetical protein
MEIFGNIYFKFEKTDSIARLVIEIDSNDILIIIKKSSILTANCFLRFNKCFKSYKQFFNIKIVKLNSVDIILFAINLLTMFNSINRRIK